MQKRPFIFDKRSDKRKKRFGIWRSTSIKKNLKGDFCDLIYFIVLKLAVLFFRVLLKTIDYGCRLCTCVCFGGVGIDVFRVPLRLYAPARIDHIRIKRMLARWDCIAPISNAILKYCRHFEGSSYLQMYPSNILHEKFVIYSFFEFASIGRELLYFFAQPILFFFLRPLRFRVRWNFRKTFIAFA